MSAVSKTPTGPKKTQARSLKRLLLFLVLVMLNLSACAERMRQVSDPPVTESWEFIDVETGKPIEGGWINFAWYGLPDKNGRIYCKRGVLGRTGADGVYSNTAKDGSWIRQNPPWIFVPGYEHFAYDHDLVDQPDMIVAYIRMNAKGDWPAWEKRFQDMGYQWQQGEQVRRTGWAKRLPVSIVAKALVPIDLNARNQHHVRYYIHARSHPPEYGLAFSNVSSRCAEPGAENVGFSDERDELTTYQRALFSYKFICDEAWDSVPVANTSDTSIWIQRSLWMRGLQTNSLPELQVLLPIATKQYMWPIGAVKPLTKMERKLFCDWLKPYSLKGISP